MMNAEVQNFQQKKWKEDDNLLTCIEDNNLTLVILDVVNRGKNVTGTTWHVLHGALVTLTGHAICQ